MAGPRNSIVNDTQPFLPPKAPAKPKKPAKSDWAKLAESAKYPEIYKWIEARKEYYRLFTPDGTSFEEVYIKDKDAATRFSAVSAGIIRELSELQAKIETEKGV